MKLEDLRPGLYRIARDTKNPKPDRRFTGDWRAAEVWRAGAVVSVVFEELGLIDEDPTAAIIAVRPYSGLAGTKHPMLHEVKVGSRTAKRGYRLTTINEREACLAMALLEVLTPHEARTVDEALQMFNDADTHSPSVSYRDIALQLLWESNEATTAVFSRVRARLMTRSEMEREYTGQDAAFAALALKKG